MKLFSTLGNPVNNPAKFAIDSELDLNISMNADPMEYALAGWWNAIEILHESHNIDWANYKPPSESAKELFAFPRALPTELKGVAV